MWDELSRKDRDEYKRMMLAFASLTEMFAQKTEDSEDIPAPIINSKYQETVFQKAFHASAEDIGNTSYDVSICQKCADNQLKKYLIGIKTFGINSGDQKVAQFKANITEWASLINQMQENAKESDGTFKTKNEINKENEELYKELAVNISILRNERIRSSIANLQGFKVVEGDAIESVYHVLMPSQKGHVTVAGVKYYDKYQNIYSISTVKTVIGNCLTMIYPMIEEIEKRKLPVTLEFSIDGTLREQIKK